MAETALVSSTSPPLSRGADALQTASGKYQLIKRLAIGGMAEIFLARTTGIEGFEKLVVLKRILPQYAEDGRFIRMFLAEARLAARLHHQNIAQVYDIGKTGGSYFFTMEFIHGIDVRQVLASAVDGEAPVPLEHALEVVIHTAAGLHHAHELRGSDGLPLGLVHRDVSPSNVLVDFEGGVKLVDFGIAKATYQRGETRPGALKGKLSYMSPEQCRGHQLDRRSDIFALGILLYELTTGTRLFDSEGEFTVLKQIVEEPVPSPSSRVAGYPRELERIVMRALERELDERYSTAQELQLDLEAFARDERLACSAVGLARYVKELRQREFDGWQIARTSGMSLAEYLTSAGMTDETDGMSTRDITPGIEPELDPELEREVDEELAARARASEPTVDLSVGGDHGERGSPADPTPSLADRARPRSRWLWLTAATLAVAGAGAIVAVQQVSPDSSADPASNQAPLPPTPVAPRPSTAAPLPVIAWPPAGGSPGTPPVAPDPSVASATPVMASPEAVVPAKIAVELRGLPPRARVVVDGRVMTANPIALARSDEQHHVSLSADGFTAREIDFVATKDLTLDASLHRLPAHKSRGTHPAATTPIASPPDRSDPDFMLKL